MRHLFYLASKPEHPLAMAYVSGWTVERTVVSGEGYDDEGKAELVFVHYVSPPASDAVQYVERDRASR